MFRNATKMVLVIASLLSLNSCLKKTDSETSSAPTLNTKSDGDLFSGNDGISMTLQQEIKRQFLAALGASGILKQLGGSTANIVLTEIGISKSEKTVLDIDATVDGKIASKTRTPSQGENTSAAEPMGVNVQTAYHVASSTYNVSFSFQERVTSTDEGEVLHFQLSKPLIVEDNFKLSSRVKISLSAIKSLPSGVAAIVARFFDDISLSLDSGITYERSSDISTRMYYKNKKSGMTELMRDFTADIIRPLCMKVVKKQGADIATCDVSLPVIGDPVKELAARLETSITEVTACKKTQLSENLMPIYKLYFPVPKGLQVYTQNSKVYLFEKKDGGWSKFGWATILGTEANSSCGLAASSQNKCLVAKFGQHFFEPGCDMLNKGKVTLGAFNEDKPNVF